MKSPESVGFSAERLARIETAVSPYIGPAQLAGAVTLTFFFYVFINMAMVSGLVPVIGLPLPLISRGGTSIVTLFVGFGLLMSIQTHKRVRRM